MILYKNADYLENWHIQSWKQESLNPNNNQITPNEDYAESSDSNTNVDFLSNGFKMRSSHRTSNYTGNTFVYMAFSVPSTDQDIDFCANGFKILSSGHHLNGDGIVFIYMAFAEAPFVNSNGVPCNAR